MKKLILLISISLTSILSLYTVEASTIQNKQIELYNIKKINNKYEITKSSKTLSSKVDTFGKEIHYNGKTYYYVKKLHKYVDNTGYNYVNRYYKEKAKANSDKFYTDGKKFIKKHNSSNDNKNTTNSNNNISDVDNNTNINIVINDAYKASYRAEALSKINQLRESVGVPPLTEDPILDQVADIRIKQNIDRGDGSISHYDSNNQPLDNIVAKQLGVTNNLAENLAESPIYESDSKNNADTLTQLYINEGPENGDGKEHGHYENIVSPYYDKIGIGFGVDKQGTAQAAMYDAEDFEYRSDWYKILDAIGPHSSSTAVDNNTSESSGN